MLSKEPPGEGWGGATTGCCGAATAGVTGAAGCRNEKKKVRIFLIDMNNGFKLWAGQRCVQTIRALLCSGLWSQIEMPWVCLTPAWPMSLMVLLLSYKTKDHWKNTCLFEFQIRENKSKIHLEGKTCYLNIYIYCKCICFSLCHLHKSIDRIFRLKDEFSTINHRGWLLVWADMA